METEKTSLTSNKFHCEKCDFKCYKYSKYERHLGTAKHRRKQLETKKNEIKIHCECGKEYSNRSGLFKHKKKCTYKTQEELLAETMKQQLEEQRKRDEEQKEEQLKLLQEQKEEQIKILQEQKEEQRKRDEEHKQQIEILTDKISGMSKRIQQLCGEPNI